MGIVMAEVLLKNDQLTKIDKFLGINEDEAGQTQLQMGESPDMMNFRITDNLKLSKRNGYVQMFASIAAKNIRCMIYTKLGGTNYFVFVCNGNVYSMNTGTGVVSASIGTLTDGITRMFNFEGKLYILNGVKYYSWDGTTYQEVVGYIPLVRIATPPAGGGTANEPFNIISNGKRQQFSGNGSSTDYYLIETVIIGVDWVKINGSTVSASTYTVTTSTGKVVFNSAPASGTNNVEIQWTKDNGNRVEIENCHYWAFFGGSNDTRVFLWGNANFKNRRYYSYLYDPTYFRENDYDEIGSDEFAITDIARQYDRQLIFKENETYYSYFDEANNIYPIYNLNSEKGNIAPGQARTLSNNPVTICEGIYEWVQSNVRDEKNAKYISKNVQTSLNTIDLTQAITWDFAYNAEYIICVGKVCWIYNYRIGMWYKYTLQHTPTSFLDIEDNLYFGTNNGQIMLFNGAYTDNGTKITAYWQSDFMDFGVSHLKKFISRAWLAIKADKQAYCELSYQTNNDQTATSEEFTAFYSMLDFSNMDFSLFSFTSNNNPQPFSFKINAKKFAFIKFIITSDDDDKTLTVLSLSLNTAIGGEIR
jgi:hypothetical protein